MEDFYKNISREDLISSLETYQTMHIKTSNELYRVNKNIAELKKWIIEEMDKTELSASVEKDEHIKGLFLGQKLSFERILSQIESFK